jgi:xanthine/CO dehydrogenase XdhC/CoxF family maturation factor
MLVRENGTYECALSGGCLEPSVAEAARQVIATGLPATIAYDLADDSLWGLGLGCNGAVDIRIEPLGRSSDDDVAMKAWMGALERGEAAALVTPLGGASGRLFVAADGGRVGRLSDATSMREAVRRAAGLLGAAFPRSGAERIGDTELFFEISLPPPALIVFGAGLDAVPLARQAWALGMSVSVVDARGAWLKPEAFPNANLVLAHFTEFAARVPIRPGSFIVVMNHHVERDRESLRFALESRAAYIGVLGPRVRFLKLLDGLGAEGCRPTAASLSRVRSPVGLSVGAETPEEVALSILAEILAVRRGCAGGFLDGSTGRLHEPEPTRIATP